MAKFVLRLKNPGNLPIQQIASNVKKTLTGPLADLVIVTRLSQAPPSFELDVLSAISDPVVVAQLLAGRMGAGVTLEAID